MKARYRCLDCGHEYLGEPGPTQCPVCGHLYVEWLNHEEMHARWVDEGMYR